MRSEGGHALIDLDLAAPRALWPIFSMPIEDRTGIHLIPLSTYYIYSISATVYAHYLTHGVVFLFFNLLVPESLQIFVCGISKGHECINLHAVYIRKEELICYLCPYSGALTLLRTLVL